MTRGMAVSKSSVARGDIESGGETKAYGSENIVINGVAKKISKENQSNGHGNQSSVKSGERRDAKIGSGGGVWRINEMATKKTSINGGGVT